MISRHSLVPPRPFIVLAVILGLASPAAAAQDTIPECEATGTPAAASETPSVSSPEAPFVDADIAWIYLQATLAEGVVGFASIAGAAVESPELANIVLQQGLDAQSDAITLEPLLPQGEAIDLDQLLAIADQTRAELDLPAGQGGSVDFGADSWIATICSTPDVTDTIIANASVDLSQQQIDLAQIAVAAGSEESQARGSAIIDRESARISSVLVFLAEASPMASPGATPGD